MKRRLVFFAILALLGPLLMTATATPAAACGSDTVSWQDGQPVGDQPNDGKIWLFISSDKTEVFWKGENGYVMQSVKGRWNTGQESDAPPPVPNNGGMSAGPQGTYFVWVQATASDCSSAPPTTQPAPTTTKPAPPPTTAPPATTAPHTTMSPPARQVAQAQPPAPTTTKPAPTTTTSKPVVSTSPTTATALPTTTPSSAMAAPLQAVKKAASVAHNNHHLSWLWWLVMLLLILLLCLLGFFLTRIFRRSQAH